MADRPPRKHIPIVVKRKIADRQGGVCTCGCGTPIWTEEVVNGRKKRRCHVIWDHSPALRIRDVNEAGTDYIPAQNDPDYLVARCRSSNGTKTFGNGATTAGSDTGLIKKERKREERRAGIARKKKLRARARAWPKGQKIPSRGFDKRHRAMRRKA